MNAENTVEFTVSGSDLDNLWMAARKSAEGLLGERKAGRLALIGLEPADTIEWMGAEGGAASKVAFWTGTFLLTVPGLYEEVSASREG